MKFNQIGQAMGEYAMYLLLILMVIVLLSGFIPSRAVNAMVTGTVTDKYLAPNNNTSTYYISVDKIDGSTEVFKNTDSIWWWKWSSADYYANIKVGEAYTFRVTGWRVPFLSWFRNIVQFTPCACTAPAQTAP